MLSRTESVCMLCFTKYLVIAYREAYNDPHGFGPRAPGISRATGVARARHGEPAVYSRNHGACRFLHGSAWHGRHADGLERADRGFSGRAAAGTRCLAGDLDV